MRILHVDTGKELRGGQRQVLLLMNGLRESGHAQVLLATPGAELWRAAEREGFVVRPVSWGVLPAESKDADLVHVHDARAHTMAALRGHAPLVVSRRVAFPIGRSPLSRWKYKRAARYLAVSDFVAVELARGGVKREKIDVVYDAVDDDCGAGEWRPEHPVVALASSDPAKGRDLVEQAAKLANAPVVYSSDLRTDLRRASMFLYISRSEGLGSAVLLALAMGIPVIASDVGGLPEVLGAGNAGLLTPNEAPAIAGAIQRLREDSVLAATFIRRGRERVMERFTARRMVEDTIAGYGRVLAG